MNTLYQEALTTAKASTKMNRANYTKIKRQFWKIVNQIRKTEIDLSDKERMQLQICMKKME